MKRFKAILFVVSNDIPAEVAFERALELAAKNQARLTVVEVIGEIPKRSWTPRDLQSRIIADRQQTLEKLVSRIGKNIKVQPRVLVGISFREITREVLREGHDLVIKMASNDDRIDRLFGSDDMHLLRKCPCPVLLLKPGSKKAFRRIIAAVDVDSHCTPIEQKPRHQLNLEILEIASSLALAEASELHVTTAWRAIGESMMQGRFVNATEQDRIEYVEATKLESEHELNKLVDSLVGKLGQDAIGYLDSYQQLLKGHASEEIPAFANKIGADLVVMGTIGRTGISGLFIGNTAETILNRIDCSVLAIKPPGFETPITLKD